MLDTVVFDLGNVLIPWDPERLYRKLIPDTAERVRFLGEICTAKWNAGQDAGRTLAEGTALKIAEHPEYEALIRAYYARWEEMLGEPIAGSVDLLHEVKVRGLRVLALTNWSAETFARARPMYPLLDEFEGILVSGDEGLIKPDPAIFRLLFARYSLTPERCAFLDDSLRNVEAAAALGMKAIHFRSPEQARADFASLGLV
jgi:2-haloacid dehalogenase